ncbi:MAG: hypothetical protein HY274_05215 [Gammaproteobacteria bacterium]|nr:hypothetical protein [Gammaproteobacteria bacterium]
MSRSKDKFTVVLNRFLVLVSAGMWSLISAWPHDAHAADLTVERLETRRFALSADSSMRINLPYFDAHGVMQFDDDVILRPPNDACSKVVNVRALLARPRVDHWQCADGKSYLAGMGAGSKHWARVLELPSGTHHIRLYPIGASADALVMSDLEVWSPLSGKTQRPAPARQLTKERSAPKYSFSSSAAYRAAQDDFIVYDAGSKQLDGKGGLYRLTPVIGDYERLAGTHQDRFAPVEVAEIQLDATGRYLLLGELSLFRGPNWTRFAVFDLAQRKRVFEERHGEHSIIHEPRIVVGPDGHVAFSYRDGGQREMVVVHYRLRSNHGATP